VAYFRKLPKLQSLLDLFSRGGRWLILISADPDAMASALALRRIMIHRVTDVGIARVNEVTRPDNLALIRYARLHMRRFAPEMAAQYDYLALVDSQPQHNPLFAELDFSVIIDHHPLQAEPAEGRYRDIRPEYGATSTLLTEHLYNLGIRPGKLLATALQFGIKSDTGNFERKFTEVDIRAYHYLVKFADAAMLSRIARSEFHRRWLDYFAKACANMHTAGSGQFVYVGGVENPDILVIIADFFMRVYEFRWVAVSGLYGDTVVVVFRGDGIARDLGTMASAQFGDIGSAGGHKGMARAEFPASSAAGSNLELFIYKRVLNGLRSRAGTGE
jgi:nanoRNase/pAp phosphatase (c-di-AMP/oligoRNAs hydrolase)